MHCTITGKSNKVYLRTAKGDFKKRLCNHRKSFNNETSGNGTTFSKYIWKLKEVKCKPNCSMVNSRKVPPYSNICKKCLLCLLEKLEIINYPRPDEQLNIRFELIYKYCPANKFLQRNHKTNHWLQSRDS